MRKLGILPIVLGFLPSALKKTIEILPLGHHLSLYKKKRWKENKKDAQLR